MPTLTNKHEIPESIVGAIERDTYTGPDGNDLDVISVTQLISPPKIRMLKHRHREEITEDVADQIWKLLGTSVHSVIERAETKDSLVEERLTMKVGSKTISGQTDYYKDGVLQDFKVTSVWSVVYNPEGKAEWTNQLNCLALLYRNAGFEVNKLQVVAILRDHQSSKARTDASYPQIPIAVIDVPLWSKESQEDYVKFMVGFHEASEALADDEIKACTPEERWQTETKYAVKKVGNKRALKVFDDPTSASLFMGQQESNCTIEERPGEDKRCMGYCPVKQFCHHGRSLGELQMEV